jgi:AcrR family transcriptional regulator
MSKGSRDRILDATEKLFAKRGSEAVSLREINVAAGVSQGVIHYQFGSRAKLITALLERRFPAIQAQRVTMLQELSSKTEPPQLRDLVEVVIRPFAELVLGQKRLGTRFMRVLSHLSTERNSQFQQYVVAHDPEFVSALIALLKQALPEQSEHTLYYRLLVISFSMYRALADLEEPQWLWGEVSPVPLEDELSADARVELLIDCYCGALLGSR